MITLHHLNNSRSQRILWLLEELGVDYQVKHYQRNAKTQLAPPELQKIHPLGKSPVIEDQGRFIAESGAIIEYLTRKYGPHLVPALDSEAYDQYSYWLHYAEGTLMPLLVIKLIFNTLKTAPMPFFIRPIAKAIADKAMDAYAGPNLANNIQFIEQHLSTHTWFTGDELSAADIQMSFPLEASLIRVPDAATRYPAIHAYVERIHALPAYQRGLEKGGPYDFA